ncbi:MAG TPA: Wzy polymerase domain-containing protein [Methylophilus sp.]|nr:Wzy polymerase domain-containing protein [Methylophilus sp.]
MIKLLAQRVTSPQASLYLVGMMFCLPFIMAYHDIPIATFYGEWLAAVLGLLALSRLLNHSFLQAMQIPRISLVFLGLLLICNLQLLIEPQLSSPQHNLLIQLYLLWACLLTTLGYHLSLHLSAEKITNTLAKAVVIAAVINACFFVLQILQRLGLSVPIPTLQSYGMLAQTNQFSDFISLAIVSLMYLYTRKQIRFKTLATGLLAGLTLLSFSGSRSSVLYLVIIALLNFLIYTGLRRQSKDTTTAKQLLQTSLILLPLFFLLQILLTTFLPQALIQTPITRTMETMGTPSASLRWQFWQTSWTLFSQSPWLGIGAGQMRWQTYLLTDDPIVNPARIFFEHAHNLFLHLLGEMGVFAGVMVLLGLAIWIYGFFKRNSLTWESWWLLGLLAIIGAHSMLEYPLWYAPFLGICAFLLGIGDTDSLCLNRLSRAAQQLLKFSLIAVMIYGAYQLYVMQIAYRKLEAQIAVASQADMSDSQKQVLVEDMIWVGENTLLAPYAELVLATYMRPSMAQSDVQIKIVESAIHFIPLRLPTLNYVVLLELRHTHPEAMQHLKRISLIAGSDLQTAIRQLPQDHQIIMLSLLAEINKTSIK